MKIKRFFSHDMRTAIRMVREELGSEAVILSNNQVNGGIEIIAAIDYDESLLDKNSEQVIKQSNQFHSSANLPKPSKSENHPVAHSGTPSVKKDREYQAVLNRLGLGKNTKQRSSPDQTIIFNTADRRYPGVVDSGFVSSANHSQSNNDFSNPFGSGETEYTDEPDNQSSEDQSESFDYFSTGNDQSSTNISESYFDAAENEQANAQQVKQPRRQMSVSQNIWSQEPTLVAMQKEITTLRGLMESQLTGLAWGDVAKKNPLRAKLLRQLLELDFSPKLTATLADVAATQTEYSKAWQLALTSVSRKLPVLKEDLVDSGGVVLLVGATGVGKTTSIAKLAARYALRSGRKNVALVTTDSYRIGAHEQLRTYGRILGIPVRIAKNKVELVEILNSLSNKDFVLVDTAGMGQRDQRLLQQFTLVRDCAPAVTTLLVLPANTHRAGLEEVTKTFSNVKIDGCILTKLDETTNLGGAISVLIEQNLPLAYVCDGQKVPEDLHLARAHAMINRCVMIARRSPQYMPEESVELAYSKMTSHAHV